MTEQTLQQKSVEILDKADGAITAFAAKLDAFATQYGPEVTEAALTVARIDAASGLVWGFVFLCVAIYAFRISREALTSYVDEIIGGISALIGLLSIVAATSQLLNIWRWIGLFQPELWIAKHVLGL